jgi:hypothetical protein
MPKVGMEKPGSAEGEFSLHEIVSSMLEQGTEAQVHPL